MKVVIAKPIKSNISATYDPDFLDRVRQAAQSKVPSQARIEIAIDDLLAAADAIGAEIHMKIMCGRRCQARGAALNKLQGKRHHLMRDIEKLLEFSRGVGAPERA